MTVESAVAFALALLAWVIVPGPAIFAIIGRALSTNFKSALSLIVGILFGDLFYMSLVLFGLAAIGQLLGNLFQVVRILGAIYLVFLGVKLWLKEPELPQHDSNNNKSTTYKSYLSGFSITLGNPKAILFHLGFLPTFFDLTAITIWDALLIMLIFITMLGSSFMIYALAASKFRRLFKDKRKIRILNRGSGTILIGAGVALAVKR